MEAAFATKTEGKGKSQTASGALPKIGLPFASEEGAQAGLPLFLQRSELSVAGPDVVQLKCDDCALEEEEEQRKVQPKLIIGAADDPHELEADRVADMVMRKPGAGHDNHTFPDEEIGDDRLQRKCATCESETADSPLAEEREEKLVQPKAFASQSPTQPQIKSHAGTTGTGAPLSPTIREKVEPVLGVDLGHVRVHTDAAAHSVAADLHAKAFTHQNHIWLGAHQSSEDVELLAHETAHVVQQGAGRTPHQLVQRAGDGGATNDGEAVRARMQSEIDKALGHSSTDDQAPATPSQPAPAGNTPASAAPQTPSASTEAHQAAHDLDRAEVARQKAELQPEATPDVDRAAEQQPQVEQAASTVQEEADKPPDPQAQGAGAQAEAPAAEGAQAEGGAGGAAAAAAGAAAGAAGGAAAAADQAASLADEAFSMADSQPMPDAPPEVVPPQPVQPVDAGGQPLAPDPETDAQVQDLAQQAQVLREQGHLLRQHAAENRANAGVIRGNLGLVQQGIGSAESGVQTAQQHLEFRRGVVEKAQQALTVSEQKAQMVGEQAPGYVDKSNEGKEKSGPVASESGSLAAENAANAPDDAEAAANAQEQGSKLNQVGSDAGNVDGAIGQSQAAAGTLVEDAARATQTNAQTSAKVDAMQEVLGQTDDRLGEMQGQNADARGQVESLMDQPAQMSAQADELDAQGVSLVEASVEIETQLHSVQESFAEGMQSVPQQKRPEAGSAEAGEETLVQREPEAGAATAPVAPPAPAQQPEPPPINIAAGVPDWLTGEHTPNEEERRAAEERERTRRQGQIDEINTLAGGHFENLDAGDKMNIALRQMGHNLFGSVGSISWPGWGGVARGAGHLAAGLIDPRAPLMGVVGGLNMMINGVANMIRKPSWGNALKMAADIATGLTIILGSITALAGVILAIMTAITIISLGTAAPVTGPVIAFCATVMSTVGGWTLTVGEIALLLQELVFLKNLYEAATAETAEQLQHQSDNLTQDVSSAGNIVMQMGMAKLAQVGGRQLQSQIAEVGGVRFAANMGARGLPARVLTGIEESGGVGAYARQTLATATEGGVRGMTGRVVGGAYRGVRGAISETWEGLTHEAPAVTNMPKGGPWSREFMVGGNIPEGGIVTMSNEARAVATQEMRAGMSAPGELPTAAAGEPPVAPREVPPEAPPAAHPNEPPVTPQEQELLDHTAHKSGSELSDAELRAERNMADRAERRPIHEEPFVEEVELPNGHREKYTRDGIGCRFSGDPGCTLPDGTHTENPAATQETPPPQPETPPPTQETPPPAQETPPPAQETPPPEGQQPAATAQRQRPLTDAEKAQVERDFRRRIDSAPNEDLANDARYERHQWEAQQDGREPMPRNEWNESTARLRANAARGRVDENNTLNAGGVENNNLSTSTLTGESREVVTYESTEGVVTRPDGITDARWVDVKSIDEGTIFFDSQLRAEQEGARQAGKGLAVVLTNEDAAVVRPSGPLASNASVLHRNSATGEWSAWNPRANGGAGGWTPIDAGQATSILGGSTTAR
ncbi:MAG: hypothetical protein QOH63_2962 [Acidobacteriota bacterium]|jgi:hypothetical protein|nr:hypothetical protein [Acidobacteriota bacterium]